MPLELPLVPVTDAHYLVLSAVLFAIGTAGVLARRNVFIVLLSLEVMLNAVNLSFIVFARHQGDMTGHLMVLFVIAVAAAEACVGLGILVALFRQKESVDVDRFSVLRG
jgi:NADH:ubiquinone oxidoreductase subunit K